jgi:ComF family protein
MPPARKQLGTGASAVLDRKRIGAQVSAASIQSPQTPSASPLCDDHAFLVGLSTPMTRERLTVALRSAGWQLAQGFLQLVYPSACFVCGRALPGEQTNFCIDCRSALTTDPFLCCPRCSGTVGPYVTLEGGCNACRDQSFHFECAVRLGPYAGLLRQVILRLKHASGEGLAEVLGELWASHLEKRLRDLKADAIVPVPLHWWRRLTRGYNQSEVLAWSMAKHLRLPCHPRWLRRVRNTPQQVGQSATARRENVRNAFFAPARAEVRGRTILLVDDVSTTGNTASDAARALRGAGAARIVVAVLAGGHG